MTDDGIIQQWFVMTHPEMGTFQSWLKDFNASRLREGRSMVEPFYPHDFLKASATMQRDMARFVFLKAVQTDIDTLLDDERNQLSSRRLRYYLDTDGRQAKVQEPMMQKFMEACMKQDYGMEIVPPLRSIEAMDRVRIKQGPFAGQEAVVSRVQLSHGAIHLDLTLEVVSGVVSIRMQHVSKNQVHILDRRGADAIRTDFIEYTQNHLLNILEHRVKRVEDAETNRRDADMLTRLYRYRHYTIASEPARLHFLALMLICAHLCRYGREEAVLREQVLASLEYINRRSASKAATDVRTYLYIALYISTHLPSYRDAAKQYVQQHEPRSQKLRHFVRLIRQGREV